MKGKREAREGAEGDESLKARIKLEQVRRIDRLEEADAKSSDAVVCREVAEGAAEEDERTGIVVDDTPPFPIPSVLPSTTPPPSLYAAKHSIPEPVSASWRAQSRKRQAARDIAERERFDRELVARAWRQVDHTMDVGGKTAPGVYWNMLKVRGWRGKEADCSNSAVVTLMTFRRNLLVTLILHHSLPVEWDCCLMRSSLSDLAYSVISPRRADPSRNSLADTLEHRPAAVEEDDNR